jgi:hypothetical protein
VLFAEQSTLTLLVMLESSQLSLVSADSNIMRPTTFDPDTLRRFLRSHKIATLPELKRALGTPADLTVFRKLKLLDYLSSYTDSGRYYTLPSIARFDDLGLWSYEAVWFSRQGTLLATVEAFVNRAPRGYFAEELARALHVEVQEPLRQLVEQGRLSRTEIARHYLYTAADLSNRRNQIRARGTVQAVPLAVADPALLQVSPHELKTAIILFYSLLDEQQRRLYAGMESLRLGHGGDTLLAEFLGLDPHTVGRGRQQLLDQELAVGRMRRPGGGRKLTEKKRPQ